MSDYDLIVIGGGAGGMSAARAGARRDKRVLLIQDGPIGGDCTWTGCVPSKALIAAAAQRRTFADAMDAARTAVKTIAEAEDDAVFASEGIDVVHARARFLDAHRVEADGRELRAGAFVIATGATAAVPPIPGLRELDGALTNENLWDLTEPPGSMAVLGGGAIGCELAQAFARLGVDVTLFEAEERILLKEEPETAAVVAAAMAADGVAIRTAARVSRVDDLGGGRARLSVDGDDSPVEVDRVLVAVGRRPVTEGLDADAAGVALTDRGFVETSDALRTTAKHIACVGDVSGHLQFTHAADEMGRIAVANLLGRFAWRRFGSAIPWVTYTSPEVGRVGLTEAEADAEHPGARVAYLPMSEVDRAVAEGRTEGYVKLIAAPRIGLRTLAGGRFVGATIVASRGGELVNEIAVAMRSRMFPARIALTPHAYPSWSVALQKASAQFFMEIEGRSARPAMSGNH